MNDVFISYSRRDKVFTQKLYEALTAAKRIVWADWDSIPAASDWDAEIKQGIQETNSVLFVLSPEWIKSNECRKEMVHAVAMGKRLFPILYLPVDPNDVPPELAKINWVYLRDTDDFDKGFQTLCSAMDTDLDWIKTHTRIQVRALEWEKKNRSASFALRGEDLTEGERFVASGANKKPVPTTLQSEYILSSRKDATRRQRQTLAGVTVALVVSIALGVVAFFQRQAAIRQAQISRVGELAAQSISLREQNFFVSLLLGVEALKATGGQFDSIQAKSVLLDNTQTNPQLKQSMSGHSASVYNIAFSPDGKTLASGGADNSIILWDVATRQPIGKPFDGHSNSVDTVAFSPDGKTLASTSFNDDTMILWDIETHQPLGEPLRGLSDSVSSIAFSPNGQTLASGCGNGTIILWDVATRQPIGPPLSGHSNVVYSVAFSPDGKTLASGSLDNTVILWDMATRQPINQPLDGHSNAVYSVAFSPDRKSKLLASASEDKTIIFWDVANRKPIGQPLSTPSPVRSIAFSPDGKTLASDNYDGSIMLWDVETRLSVGQLFSGNPYPGYLHGVAFSPDGKTLASGTPDATIILWDLQNRQLIGQILHGHSAEVNTVAFSPNDKIFVSGGADSAIILWVAATRQPVGQPLDGHSGSVFTIAFSPDGETLASGSDDNIIILWDVKNRQLIGNPLSGHSAKVNSLAFSPDGETLASGSADNTIILWDITPQSWAAESCQRVGRNFTRAEWEKYGFTETYRKTCEQWPLEPEVSLTPAASP